MGIDPGTTSGIAIFDIDGTLLATESRKHFSRNAIIRFITRFGTPAIIASDITPLPKLLEKIASSFHAKTYNPEKILTRLEKHRLAKVFSRTFSLPQPWKNRHERDALIAGWKAYKNIRPTIDKINRRLQHFQVSEYGDLVKEHILWNKGSVADILEARKTYSSTLV